MTALYLPSVPALFRRFLASEPRFSQPFLRVSIAQESLHHTRLVAPTQPVTEGRRRRRRRASRGLHREKNGSVEGLFRIYLQEIVLVHFLKSSQRGVHQNLCKGCI